MDTPTMGSGLCVSRLSLLSHIEKCIKLSPASTQLAVHCDRSEIDSQAGGVECPCYNIEKCIKLSPASTHSRLSTVSAATCQI
ncbi:hypothetical protein J6590_046424 [Homalodisca vitripennis]|nr:hypothetical protein J6590_046424 [Homalodisca vitripennis]